MLVASMDNGDIVRKLTGISVPVDALVLRIVTDWFVNWLPLCDILYLTAIALLTSDTATGGEGGGNQQEEGEVRTHSKRHRYPAVVAAGLVVALASLLDAGEEDVTGVNAELFGAEIIIRAAARLSWSPPSSPSFTTRGHPHRSILRYLTLSLGRLTDLYDISTRISSSSVISN